jgi:hypothetical protein
MGGETGGASERHMDMGGDGKSIDEDEWRVETEDDDNPERPPLAADKNERKQRRQRPDQSREASLVPHITMRAARHANEALDKEFVTVDKQVYQRHERAETRVTRERGRYQSHRRRRCVARDA